MYVLFCSVIMHSQTRRLNYYDKYVLHVVYSSVHMNMYVVMSAVINMRNLLLQKRCTMIN